MKGQTIVRKENTHSGIDSDRSRYKTRERFSVFPGRDLNREFQLVHSWLAFQCRFSVTEKISGIDSDRSRYKARERSLVFPARDLNQAFHSVSLLMASFSVSLFGNGKYCDIPGRL